MFSCHNKTYFAKMFVRAFYSHSQDYKMLCQAWVSSAIHSTRAKYTYDHLSVNCNDEIQFFTIRKQPFFKSSHIDPPCTSHVRVVIIDYCCSSSSSVNDLHSIEDQSITNRDRWQTMQWTKLIINNESGEMNRIGWNSLTQSNLKDLLKCSSATFKLKDIFSRHNYPNSDIITVIIITKSLANKSSSYSNNIQISNKKGINIFIRAHELVDRRNVPHCSVHML